MRLKKKAIKTYIEVSIKNELSKFKRFLKLNRIKVSDEIIESYKTLFFNSNPERNQSFQYIDDEIIFNSKKIYSLTKILGYNFIELSNKSELDQLIIYNDIEYKIKLIFKESNIVIYLIKTLDEYKILRIS